jgi:uncharacterized protein YkwD
MARSQRHRTARASQSVAFGRRTVVVGVLVATVVAAAALGLGIVPLDGGPGPIVVPDGVDTAADTTPGAPTGGPGVTPGVGDSPASPTGDTPGTATDDTVDTAIVEAAIHERVNEIRRDRNRSTLAYDGDLAEIAAYYSRRMADEDFFAHTAPDGQTLLDRYDRFGYECRVDTGGQRYVTGGENLAYTYAYVPVRTEGGVVSYDGNETRIAHGIVEGWMNSPGHRENLLRPYWNREGIGVVLDAEDGRTRVVATQNFC